VVLCANRLLDDMQSALQLGQLLDQEKARAKSCNSGLRNCLVNLERTFQVVQSRHELFVNGSFRKEVRSVPCIQRARAPRLGLESFDFENASLLQLPALYRQVQELYEGYNELKRSEGNAAAGQQSPSSSSSRPREQKRPGAAPVDVVEIVDGDDEAGGSEVDDGPSAFSKPLKRSRPNEEEVEEFEEAGNGYSHSGSGNRGRRRQEGEHSLLRKLDRNEVDEDIEEYPERDHGEKFVPNKHARVQYGSEDEDRALSAHRQQQERSERHVAAKPGGSKPTIEQYMRANELHSNRSSWK
jgi:hypothetical protein